MSEKRFTYEYEDFNGNLFDNKMNTFYHIEDSDENIEILCDRLNRLVEENEQLKEKIKGFESCSHNWSILYDEAKNKVEVLSKENKILKSLL